MRKNFSRVSVWILLIAGLTGFPADANCQGSGSQSVFWLRYQLQMNFNEQVYWTNEIDNRRFIDPDVQTQLIMHSRLHYRKKPWDYATGLTLSWAYSSDKYVEVSHATMEIRPVVEISHEKELGASTLLNRFRIDNRFFETDRFDGVSGDYYYVARFRYRIQGRIPIRETRKGPILIKLADEIMVNHKENFFDQNRVYASAEIPLSKRFTVEPGYIYIYQQRFATDLFVQRHVLRFSLLHKISF